MGFLTQEEIERMNQLSLRLLEEVGVRVDHAGVAQKLVAAGCPELPSGMLAIPRELVAECLSRCPRTVRLAGTNGDAADLCAGGPIVFWPGNALCIVEGAQARPIAQDDFVKLTRVADALEHVRLRKPV